MRAIRVVVVDDHQAFRRGLRNILALGSDVVWVGEYATCEALVAEAGKINADVVLMDIHMPGINGIEAAAQLIATQPNIRVLMLTMIEDDESIFAAMRAGARGYLLKGAGQTEILRAIRAVASGEAIFGSGLAQRMMRYFAEVEAPPAPAAGDGAVLPKLTERETAVLTLLARGATTSAIARALAMSEKTVRNHLSSIFGKLEVSDRVQAVLRARAAGLDKKS
jgi:DNA-binding NarL/FixJ family response regulator